MTTSENPDWQYRRTLELSVATAVEPLGYEEAGLTHCSAHGLRKAGATIAAENGATEEQLKAIFGWENAKEANLYTRKAREKLIASVTMSLLNFGESVNIHIGKSTPNSGCNDKNQNTK
ncbi:phage integrase family protein [Agrobacterium vitis]|uniref:tyrosine-type recombinase/integrase n=1 Tax=Allorhizobium ampelinum TaxID=3025782 RepID=UPI001F26FD66|nr:tyrosine-type recombinase/integrase [Allorhizobium ampelinum]MCF1461164.1 phage integrase family protein [Allorhizobium ampelinum]